MDSRLKKSGSKKSHKAKDKDKDIIQINVRNIRLSKESRKCLRKIKDELWGSVANGIECGNWYIPVKNHRYTHIKEMLEKGMREFYSLNDDAIVAIDDFDTNIIEYDNH